MCEMCFLLIKRLSNDFSSRRFRFNMKFGKTNLIFLQNLQAHFGGSKKKNYLICAGMERQKRMQKNIGLFKNKL